MNDVDLGWLAGIMDGEGTITMVKRYGKHRRGFNFRSPALSMTSTDYEILVRVQRLAGGTINKVTRYRERVKQAWIWSRNGGPIILETLRLIEPHLSCPKKQRRAQYQLANYQRVTKPNGHYSLEERELKVAFEVAFFEL